MYYIEEIQVNEAGPLLETCGLSIPQDVDYTVGVFSDGGKLAATGSLKGDMIQGIAVDPACQGEDLTAKVLTELIRHAENAQALYLFTKPKNVMQFSSLGFRPVAKARPYAALLEWGQEAVKAYQDQLQDVRTELAMENPKIGALVMNCNPFTLGHRYLIEQAALQCDHVYVLVVEENLSRFSFDERLMLVKQGTADLDNVTVLSGGRYAVSALTFPSYFTKDEQRADAHAAIDAEIFCSVIAPALGVNCRFVGTEPLSAVTKIYNETLKQRLPKYDIEVVELPRLEEGSQPISASRVRELIDQGGDASWEEIRRLVPETTFHYLEENHYRVTLMELLDAREARVMHQQELLEKYEGPLVSMTLNIPGAVKDKPQYRRVLELGMEKLNAMVGEKSVVYREIRHGHTGAEGYLCVDSACFDGDALKETAISLEQEAPWGRLLDIDVLTKAGAVSRAALGYGSRKCLLCNDDAKVCARSQKHNMGDLLKKIDEIIDQTLEMKENEK